MSFCLFRSVTAVLQIPWCTLNVCHLRYQRTPLIFASARVQIRESFKLNLHYLLETIDYRWALKPLRPILRHWSDVLNSEQLISTDIQAPLMCHSFLSATPVVEMRPNLFIYQSIHLFSYCVSLPTFLVWCDGIIPAICGSLWHQGALLHKDSEWLAR